jgi:SHS2 domain-containing protein
MYRWVDHTSELELEVAASTEAGVFEEGVRALSELLGATGAKGSVPRWITVAAADRPALLAAWLEELVFLAESEGFVPVSVEAIELEPAQVTATVLGAIGEPPPLIKAVTYHQLEFTRGASGYSARVVLDV